MALSDTSVAEVLTTKANSPAETTKSQAAIPVNPEAATTTAIRMTIEAKTMAEVDPETETR